MESTFMSECVICFEIIPKIQRKILDCNHVYHVNCIYKWSIKENSCPKCRKVFDFDTDNQKDFLEWMDIKLEKFDHLYQTDEEYIKQLIRLIDTAIRFNEKNIKCSPMIYEIMLEKLILYKNEFYSNRSWCSCICNIITFGFFRYEDKWYVTSIKKLKSLSKSGLQLVSINDSNF